MSEPAMVDDGNGDKMDALLLAATHVISRSSPPRACWGDYGVEPADWLALQAVVMERLRDHAREACMPPPYAAIGRLLVEAMDRAVANGANSVSMPDDYVAIAAWLPPQQECDGSDKCAYPHCQCEPADEIVSA
jgi:hypothetical protein